MKLCNKKILITGGGSGIGLELARLLSEQGNEVIICGRSETNLKSAVLLIPALKYICCDITQIVQVRSMLEQLKAEGPLDILINNAGIIYEYNLLEDTEVISKARQEFETNFFSVIRVTRMFMPLLYKSRDAAIVNVTSGLAYVPQVTIPTYSASKAALHSYTLSLRHLLRPSGIKVFELLPTYTQTGLEHTAPMKKISPRVVAEACMAGMRKDIFEIRVKNIRALDKVNRLAPSIAFRIINGKKIKALHE